MSKTTKIPKDYGLLEQVVEKYETKIKELQEELKKAKTSSKSLLHKSRDLEFFSRELKQRATKAIHSYNSLEQLLNATRIPILFLDTKLRIKRYTPALKNIFEEADFENGKLLADVLRPFTFKKLNKKIQNFLQDPQPQGLKFHLHELQKWYITSITPFPATGDAIQGIIITFLNISEDKKYEKKLNRLNQTLELEIQKRDQQVKKLASELLEAEKNERKRIAKLLHNDLQQILFSTQTKVKFLEEETPPKFAKKIAEINTQLESSLKLTHQLVVNLNPPNIKNNNLRKGINWLCEYIYNLHDLLVEVQAPRHIELENRDVLVLVLRIIQEFLFNIVKHANVNKAKIIITQKKEDINIHMVDKGTGFNKYEIKESPSYGLSEAKEHIELIGGHLFISSTPGEGTDVGISIPGKDHIKPHQLNLKI